MYRETFYVQGKRKKESDTTISCNLNGLKASFGFWAVTEKEGVETLFGSLVEQDEFPSCRSTDLSH